MRTFDDPETLKKARTHFRTLVALTLPEMQHYTGLTAPQELNQRLLDPYTDVILITAWNLTHGEDHPLPYLDEKDAAFSDEEQTSLFMQAYCANLLMFWFMLTFGLAFETEDKNGWRPGPELTILSLFESPMTDDNQYWIGPPSLNDFFGHEDFRRILRQVQASLPPGTNLPPDARALLDLAFPD